METLTRPQKEKTRVAWGIETLAQRYPEGIFVIGQAQTALASVVEMIELEQIKPALGIGTPAGFVEADVMKDRLRDSLIPHIRIDGRKGGAIVAAAVLEGLVDLAWEAYGKDTV